MRRRARLRQLTTWTSCADLATRPHGRPLRGSEPTAPGQVAGPIPVTRGRELRSSFPTVLNSELRASARRFVVIGVVALGALGGIAFGVVAITGGSGGKPSEYSLRVANTSAGRMVVTGGGLTVYIYLPDQTRPSRTACTGDCANDWPPVFTTAPAPKVAGIGKSRIGVLVRPDGSRQLTLNGYPLYRYVADHRPGDTRGESVGNTWFAVDPIGNFVPLSPAGFSPRRVSVQPLRVTSTATGDIVTSNDGQTLYTFKDDTPTGSACTPAWCVQDWPPALLAQPITAVGGTLIGGISAPLGTLRRSDGGVQITLAGHPLYRFSGDERPGDIRGSGVGGDWFPIRPDGSRAGS